MYINNCNSFTSTKLGYKRKVFIYNDLIQNFFLLSFLFINLDFSKTHNYPKVPSTYMKSHIVGHNGQTLAGI